MDDSESNEKHNWRLRCRILVPMNALTYRTPRALPLVPLPIPVPLLPGVCDMPRPPDALLVPPAT